MEELYRVRDRNTEEQRGEIWGENLSADAAHRLKEEVVGAGHSRTARVEPMSADPDVIGEPATKLQHAHGIGYHVDPVPVATPKAPQEKPWDGYIRQEPPKKEPPVVLRNPRKAADILPTLAKPIVHGQNLPAPNDPVLAAARAAAQSAAQKAAQEGQQKHEILQQQAQEPQLPAPESELADLEDDLHDGPDGADLSDEALKDMGVLGGEDAEHEPEQQP